METGTLCKGSSRGGLCLLLGTVGVGAMRFTAEITAKLKSYVYVYSDPRTGKPFYIGKGIGNRAFAHLRERGEANKIAEIRQIRRAGLEPRIDVLRYGLTNDEASLVEAAVIDFAGLRTLTNQKRGDHSRSFARISSKDLIAVMTAKPAKIRHKAILITINKLYRSDMTDQELYEATRGTWVVGKRRERAELAMAVYQGIVREVYRIHRWWPSGTLGYRTRDARELKRRGRWEFEGEVARNLRERYVGKSVRRYLKAGSQNPIRYVNLGPEA